MSIWTILGIVAAVLALGYAVDLIRRRRERPSDERLEKASWNDEPDNRVLEETESMNFVPSSKQDSTILAVTVMAKAGNFGRFEVQPGFSGNSLLRSFQTLQLSYGKFNIFHRLNGRSSLFSVASVSEPGEFCLNEMNTGYYAGVLFFMKLPVSDGTPALEAFESMIETAIRLSTSLGGQLCDQQGRPLSSHVIDRLRQVAAAYAASDPLECATI